MASPTLKYALATDIAAKTAGDLLVLPLFESDLADNPEAQTLSSVDNELSGLLLKAAAQEGFKAKGEQSFVLHTHGKLPVDRVLLLGLGNRSKFNPETLRLAAGRAAKTATRLRAQEVLFALPNVRDVEQCVKASVEGFGLGAYKFDRYKTGGKDDKTAPKAMRVKVLLAPGQEKSRALDEVVTLGAKVAEATNWARDLVNEPGGVVTPARLADEAKKAAKAHGLQITVGGWKEIRQLKMGMFEGVAQGSANEPRLVKVSYVPKNQKHAKRQPLALVGKAITFDSGGLSLKTAEGMVDMKTDMAGSAAVLGAMQVIAELAPPFPVHAYLGACENMPSGTAYRPGDILISREGKTVEITNTDAEGRLVLGDILSWAREDKPALLIDIATLTGACMIALGHYVAGAFSEDDQAIYQVLEAGRSAGEEMWRLPISEMQKDALRSEVADMKNSGERYGGAINAAVFLKEFVGDTPWVHLDIAGPSQSPKERGYHAKGATGYGVRTFVELVRKRAQEQA
ncbi:MAG TPA: leucyl aminopeptidase [Myxococcaceae bacterium]|nr:leucyl aminopeptidase [Myxococcaceae bacterium]